LLIILSISLIFPSVWELIQVFIEKFWRFQPKKVEGGFFGGFLTGISLGIVWTPCIGPIVATVATLAAVSSINLLSIIIVLTYAIGTGLPLYFIAKGGKSVSERVAFFKQKNQKVRQIFGIIVLASALFIWSGADRAFQAWTLSNLPEFWTQLPSTFENIFNVESQF
jgi:cytochrome c biogenesis protein CcdA